MPYTPEHKAQTRARIVHCAKELFNRKGYHGVGIDAIMEAAGRTRGGFYAHFKSKEDLLAAVLRESMTMDDGPGGASPRELVDTYLSMRHVRAVEEGCFMPTLAPDVFRSDPAVQAAFGDVFDGIIDRLVARGARTREQAMSSFALCVGAVALARGLADDEQAEALLAACRARLLGGGGGGGQPPQGDPGR